MNSSEDLGVSLWRRHRQTVVSERARGEARASLGEGLHARHAGFSSVLMRRGRERDEADVTQRPMVVGRRAAASVSAKPYAVHAPRVGPMSAAALDVSLSRASAANVVHVDQALPLARTVTADALTEHAAVTSGTRGDSADAHASQLTQITLSPTASDARLPAASVSAGAVNLPIARSLAERDTHPLAAPVNSDARSMRLARAFAASVSHADSTSRMPFARLAGSSDGQPADAHAGNRSFVGSDSLSKPLARSAGSIDASGTNQTVTMPLTGSVAKSDVASLDAGAANRAIAVSGSRGASSSCVPVARSVVLPDASATQLPIARSVALSESNGGSSSAMPFARNAALSDASATQLPIARSVALSKSNGGSSSAMPLVRNAALSDASSTQLPITRSVALSESNDGSSSAMPLVRSAASSDASSTQLPIARSVALGESNDGSSSAMPLVRNAALSDTNSTQVQIARSVALDDSNGSSSSATPNARSVMFSDASATQLPIARSVAQSDSYSNSTPPMPLARSIASAVRSIVLGDSSTAFPPARPIALPKESSTQTPITPTRMASNSSSPMPLARTVASQNASSTQMPLARSITSNDSSSTPPVASPDANAARPSTAQTFALHDSSSPMPLARSIESPDTGSTHRPFVQGDTAATRLHAVTIAHHRATSTTPTAAMPLAHLPQAQHIAASHTQVVAVKARMQTPTISRFPLRLSRLPQEARPNRKGDATADVFADRTAAQYGVLSPPAPSATPNTLPNTTKAPDPHTNASTTNIQNPDPEELAEQAWRLILDKLAIEQERRGYTS